MNLTFGHGPDQDRPADLATRLREAWADRQERRQELPEVEVPERDTSEGLAARLRSAFSGVDRDALRERLSSYRQEREDHEVSTAQERQRERHLENDLEQERHAVRDRGYDHEL